MFGRTKTVKDPVCGMRIDPATADAHAGHAGRTYYFCSQNCADLFKAHPARFVTGGRRPMNAATTIRRDR